MRSEKLLVAVRYASKKIVPGSSTSTRSKICCVCVCVCVWPTCHSFRGPSSIYRSSTTIAMGIKEQTAATRIRHPSRKRKSTHVLYILPTWTSTRDTMAYLKTPIPFQLDHTIAITIIVTPDEILSRQARKGLF